MWKQEFVDTERGIFEIFIKGNGHPICITHFYSAYNIKGNTFANPFTDHHTVYLINLRGAGNSAKEQSKDDFSMKETVKDLEAIRRALEFDQWAFAGHSTGGMLGLVYAIQAPEALTKMTIGGAAASNQYMYHPDSIYCKGNSNNERLIEILTLINNAETPIEMKKSLGREWTSMSIFLPEKYDEYFNKPNSGSNVPARLDYYSYTELPNYDIRSQLPIITVPTIVFCGIHDAQCPYVFSQEIAKNIPNTRLFTFHYSNHLPFTEEPEKFEEMVASQ